jgi:hypothetical protein
MHLRALLTDVFLIGEILRTSAAPCNGPGVAGMNTNYDTTGAPYAAD